LLLLVEVDQVTLLLDFMTVEAAEQEDIVALFRAKVQVVEVQPSLHLLTHYQLTTQ
jgi:hypothetical protein